MLEQLLLETELQIVVLDPNSDFARLGQLRPDADGDDADRYTKATRSLAVRRADDGLALRLAELDPATQAAAFRLDPIGDREEYAELAALTDSGEALTLEQLERLERDGGAGGRLIGRARNLGLHRWGIWAGADRTSVLSELGAGRRALPRDRLGSLATREEQALASAAVLGELWRRREERRPVLIVVDEAHNVCPARPEDPLTAIATEHAVRIAGEGRKFGLYLFVSTQRPQKVHENVLSQCDNLLLMRMNSLADLGYVGEVFSFVPNSLLERATTFRQGESLAAGLISPHPAFLRFGKRARPGGRRRRGRRLVAAAHLTGLSSTTSSTRSRPSGRCVISRTLRSSAAARMSRTSSSAVSGSRWAVGSSSTSTGASERSARATVRR